MAQLTRKDIYRYRKQRGVNLGSWFVLEKWITGRPFEPSGGNCDLDIAKGPGAKQVLESHWDAWITQEDWKWIAENGINSVRIPIGYYHLVDAMPDAIKNTDFDGHGDVFQGAWKRILAAIATAEKHGCGVLIDLHSAVGKQNGDAHSGVNGPVRFYDKQNLDKTLFVLRFLAQALKDIPNIVGLQLVNEPQNHGSLPSWYTSALNQLSSADLPLYIHDAWSTHQYADLLQSRNDFTVLDHHLYRCFTQEDQQKTGDDHATALTSQTIHDFRNLSSKTRGNLVVAEYSAALNPQSFRSGDAGEHDRQRRVFMKAQLDLYEECCGGMWFWCYKKQEGWDAGWSLKDATRAEIAPSFWGQRKTGGRFDIDNSSKDRGRNEALSQHSGYWRQHPGHYEHWRFEMGYNLGWEDAFEFFNFGEGNSVSEIGFKGQWCKKRTVDHVKEMGNSNVWEFEHGFTQGVDAARQNMLHRISR